MKLILFKLNLLFIYQVNCGKPIEKTLTKVLEVDTRFGLKMATFHPLIKHSPRGSQGIVNKNSFHGDKRNKKVPSVF